MVDPIGIEPAGLCPAIFLKVGSIHPIVNQDRAFQRKSGGPYRDRTDDLMLAKHALYQLSYGPNSRGNVRGRPQLGAVIDPSFARPRVTQGVVGPGGLEPPTSRLSGVCSNQLSYRPLSGPLKRPPPFFLKKEWEEPGA